MSQTAISVRAFVHCILYIEKQREKMENNGNEMCNEMPDDTSTFPVQIGQTRPITTKPIQI